MTILALLIFASALIADSISPGPTVASLIARVLSRGVRGVLPFLIAIWSGEALWLSAAIAGLAALAATFSLLFEVIKWVGVVYLFCLAWGLFRSKPEVEAGLSQLKTVASQHSFRGFLSLLGIPRTCCSI